MKSIREELTGVYGNFIWHGNYIYSTVEHEEDTLHHAATETHQHEIQVSFAVRIDLDDLTEEVRPHLNQVLKFFDIVIKHALREKNYEQIGRFPKFFLAEEKVPINEFRLHAWPGYEV